MTTHRLAADRLVQMSRPHSSGVTTVAGRFTHAFVEGAARTLCGIPLDVLHWREIAGEVWDDLSPMLRCRLCEEGIAAPTTGRPAGS